VRAGDAVAYLGPRGLADFDLVLSFTGGRALTELRTLLGARRVEPCYGHVDPDVHQPAPPVSRFRSDLSYLGTYSADRQDALERLFIEPARSAAQWRFCLAGAQYPESFPWTPNIFFVRHLPPADHPAFFGSSRLTLNVTRRAMAQMGYCPSGRLFEAAACGVPIVTDAWEGLDSFFTPGEEILVASDAEEMLDALRLPPDVLRRIAARARERTLDAHTADRRAAEMELAIERCVTDAAGSH
jgi:spore maturation protein CgeB